MHDAAIHVVNLKEINLLNTGESQFKNQVELVRSSSW